MALGLLVPIDPADLEGIVSRAALSMPSADPEPQAPREMRPLRHVSRVLVAPDGSRHRVRVPVYGPPDPEGMAPAQGRFGGRRARRGRASTGARPHAGSPGRAPAS